MLVIWGCLTILQSSDANHSSQHEKFSPSPFLLSTCLVGQRYNWGSISPDSLSVDSDNIKLKIFGEKETIEHGQTVCNCSLRGAA